jgi:hypothetical protein
MEWRSYGVMANNWRVADEIFPIPSFGYLFELRLGIDGETVLRSE